MLIEIKETHIVVTREKTDSKFYGEIGAKGESRFLHHLKNSLNSMGFDFIKKRMWKDGNLVDEIQQYLRARNPLKLKMGDIYCIWNSQWAITGLNDDFNEGEVVIMVCRMTENEMKQLKENSARK